MEASWITPNHLIVMLDTAGRQLPCASVEEELGESKPAMKHTDEERSANPGSWETPCRPGIHSRGSS